MSFCLPLPEVRQLKHVAGGIIFVVKSGKSLLRTCVVYDPNSDACIHTLAWRNSPLIRFWSESGCPTCEEFVYDGFANDKDGAAQFLSSMETWNSPYSNINDSFAALTPLFSLFADGYYMLEERDLYPTDGNGQFFWCVNNEKTLNPATTSLWDCDDGYMQGHPSFLLPSQPPSHFNRQRVDYYLDKPSPRALAWHIGGTWLNILLDGHHKATAAALKRRPVKSLVITQPTHLISQLKLIFPGGESLEETEFLDNIPFITQPNILPVSAWDDYFLRNDYRYDSIDWPAELETCVKHYPDLRTAGKMAAVGDISSARILQIIEQDSMWADDAPDALLLALFYNQSESLLPFAQYIATHSEYASYHQLAFTLLAKERTPQTDEFFLNFAINDDGERPELTKIMDHYFLQPQAQA